MEVTDKWSDFATNDIVKDLISLTSYIKGISSVEAYNYIGIPKIYKKNSKTYAEAFTLTDRNNEAYNFIQEDIKKHNLKAQKFIKNDSSR